jgi:NitT/TauT family transport system substrate-binding protein
MSMSTSPRARIPAPLLALTVALTACGGGSSAGTQDSARGQDLDHVSLALAWMPVADSAPWYSALDKGWFEEEGLDVEILRGFGSGDTLQRVATGNVDFGQADLAALVPQRVNEDIPVVAVAAFYAEPFHAVYFRPGDGIEEPRDLEGRSISCSAGNANMLMFPAFADATGIDADTLEWKLGEPASIVPGFTSGQTDLACSVASDQPVIQAQSDVEVDHFAFVDHGVSLHSQMIVTSASTVEERPDLVERFLRAALRGLEFAVEHPEEAVEILLRHEPDLDPALTHESWALTVDLGLMRNEDTDRHGFGHISGDRMESTFETLLEAAGLDGGDHTADDLYTDAFLP